MERSWSPAATWPDCRGCARFADGLTSGLTSGAFGLYIGREIASAFGPAERRLWRKAPVILIYHRVDDPQADFWGITVGPDRFAEQIEALTTVRRVLPLGELAAAAASGRRYDRPLAAVTFDDGYHDVFDAARPILERFDCPATVFMVTDMVDAAREFWWDEVASIFLGTPQLPAELELDLGERTAQLRFADGDPAPRIGACHGLRHFFLSLPSDDIESRLATLRAWAGVDRAARPSHRAMTSAEVAALGGGPIEVGAHTASHPVLTALDPASQRREIEASRAACEALTGRPAPYFAYPFGRYDRSAWRAVREAGFAGACATIPGPVLRTADPFLLPRFAPEQMDGEQLARALS